MRARVIYNFRQLDLKCDLARLISCISNNPDTVELNMAGNDIAETKNAEPKIVQTYPLCLFALMRANAVDLFAAVLDDVTDCESLQKRMISKRPAS